MILDSNLKSTTVINYGLFRKYNFSAFARGQKMDVAEVHPRPRSRSSSMSEEEMAVQAIIDENKQCDESLAEGEKRRPPKRLRNNDSSDERQCVDEEGFTLVQRKVHRGADRKLRGATVRGTNKLITNYYEVCVSSYKLLPKQIGLAMLLKAEGITNATQIKYKSPYRVVISFENKDDANKLVANTTFMESGFRCYLTSEVGITYGVVKYLELEVKEEDLMASLHSDQKIVSVKRLNRMSEEGEWVSSETVRFGFNGSTLPSYVFGYGCRFKVDPYTFPVTQCASCWKYGHLTRTCPTKKPFCPKCGRGHTNCETTEYRCVNCKGKHMALSKSCPIYLKEREIRSIMCQENCIYKVALSKYLENKARKFDPRPKDPSSFFMFGDEPSTKRYEPVRPTMSYSQSVGAKKVIQTEALIHLDEDVLRRNMDSDDESNDSSEDSSPRKGGKKKKNRREKRREKRMSRTAEGVQEAMEAASPAAPVPPTATTSEKKTFSKNQKNNSSFGNLFTKVKDILFSRESFEEKVSQVLKLLFEELMSFIVQMMSSGDVITKLLGLFHDG